MEQATFSAPTWYRLYALFVIAVTAVLIWWGAAVTTENVGMAVPDWPLSFGTINPKGWWLVPALRLEHGHRVIASFVGLLTIGLAVGAWLGTKSSILRKTSLIAVGLVILQGVLGGLRVIHISDEFGIIHGCLGQSFFCVLILIFLMAHRWEKTLVVDPGQERWIRRGACLSFGAIFLQLVFGAILRHTQRFHLADDSVILTGDSWFPGFASPDLLILFLHKWWAVVVTMILLVFGTWAARRVPPLRIYVLPLGVAVCLQVVLGIMVILTGKSFWITNIHVLNGLALLAGAFVLLVQSLRAVPSGNPAVPTSKRELDPLPMAAGRGSI
ncbi:MAG: COX15/CtaA family protein [Verrucomicrobiota bacterium]